MLKKDNWILGIALGLAFTSGCLWHNIFYYGKMGHC
jgi:hypothetical protein